MRTFGALLLIAGAAGFWYCSTHLSAVAPVPEGTELGRYLESEAGRLELGRYLSVIVAMVGVLLAMFPKGR